MVLYYIVITLISFMDYQSLLNEHQYAAVTTDSQYVRVVAGAGSGKTRVLTYRLAYLVGEKNVEPFSIVAIAFTNKVANEMKVRALSLLGRNYAGLQVSTFHSFCAKFLRREIDVLGFPVNFTIFDDDDTETLIKNIAVENGFKKNDDITKFTIGYIGFYKCKGYYPEDIVLDNYASEKEKTALKFFHIYEQRKNEMFALDFDDLLLKTIHILKEYPHIQDKWQKRISNILVDEFQDTNDVQYELIKLLMNEDTALYVVGDPDQTIYTWRGANQNIILQFNKNFPCAETIILDRNYRSTKTILDTANKLISNNKKRIPKDLYTENNVGESIAVKQTRSREEEAKYVVDQIEQLHLNGVDYKDIALLYRSAYVTLPFENELMRRRIPYQILGGLKFFQRKEVKDVLAYFRLIYNFKDDVSFERIINVPRRGLGDKTIDVLKNEREYHGLSYIEYIQDIDKYDTELKPKNVIALSVLVGQIVKTKARLNENLEAYSKILEDFIRDIGYYEYLQEDDDTAEERLGNVKALFENVMAFEKEYPESSFDEYLQNAALQTSQDEMRDEDQIKMMTIHVAKGLEFDYVFVIAMNEGTFPSMKTIDEVGHDGLEEERRVCYVAFTRAKRKLFVTFNKGYSFIIENYGMPSRFIKESGLEIPFEPYNTSKGSSLFGKIKSSSSFGFYEDEPAYDDFVKSIVDGDDKPKKNDVDSWSVGDIAIHDTFGRGVVTKVIDAIIEVEFEQHGKKSILGNHPKVHKEEKGAKA